jgi:sugar lactone lactonase YvrE
MTTPNTPTADRPDAPPPSVAPGWRVERIVSNNPLWASNGIAFGPDGSLYIAQFNGGQISTLDIATGHLDVIIGSDGPLTAPDDIAFDADGTMYVVDLPPGLVWRWRPDGDLRVVADGIVAPDGVACRDGRLFVNELHTDGRLLEVDLDGGQHRVLATGLALGNAMQFGPDGLLYYPHLLAGEVWRVDVDNPEPELVAKDIDRSVAVRFDQQGVLNVLSCNTTGTFTSIDLATGTRVAVDTGITGADNFAFDHDGRLFVSSAFRGGIAEVAADGSARTVVPQGLNGPFGVAVTPDGEVVVADHYGIAVIGAGGALTYVGELGRTIPMGALGVTADAHECHVTTTRGEIHSGDPRRGMRRRVTGLSAPHGITTAPDGGLLVAETGRGRVLHVDRFDQVTVVADGLAAPVDVVVDHRGVAHVSESGAGRITRLDDGAVLAADLHGPEGLAWLDGALYCLEARARRLVRVDPHTSVSETVADGLALAVLPDHVLAQEYPDPAIPRRPQPFAGLAVAGADLVVGASGDGSVLRLSRVAR